MHSPCQVNVTTTSVERGDLVDGDGRQSSRCGDEGDARRIDSAATATDQPHDYRLRSVVSVLWRTWCTHSHSFQGVTSPFDEPVRTHPARLVTSMVE